MPFAAGLAVAFALLALRLAGLAAAVALGGGFVLPPGPAQQKMLLVAFTAQAMGAVADLAFKPAPASQATRPPVGPAE